MTISEFTGLAELDLRRSVVFEHLQLARKWVADLEELDDDTDVELIEAVRRERLLSAYLRWIDQQIDAYINAAMTGMTDARAVAAAADSRHRHVPGHASGG